MSNSCISTIQYTPSQFLLCADNDPVVACPQLTHLTFNEIEIDHPVYYLPCQILFMVTIYQISNTLSFRECKEALQGKLGLLFEFTWPKLSPLDVSKCLLDSNDLMVICAATNSSLEKKLPSLTSLAISPKYETDCTG